MDRTTCLGVLRDESGEITISFRHMPDGIREGDILQVSGYFDQKTFVVELFERLVPGSYFHKDRDSRWRQLMMDESQRELIRFRSAFLKAIREFFWERDFIEIDAPALVPAAGMEPHIEPFRTELRMPGESGTEFFLHTSPEFVMKKMLVAGYEKIFYVGHVFRNGEEAPLHSPEFTMLEWYRAYQDYNSLMKDCQQLVSCLKENLQPNWSHIWREDGLLARQWETRTLTEIMKSTCGFDLGDIGIDDHGRLIKILRQNEITEGDDSWTIEDLFFLLFLNRVEPKLGKSSPLIVKDYPVWMASLAKRMQDRPNFVERFEVYIDRVELANGFTELNDPDEQLQRLEEEQRQRRDSGRTQIPIDKDFVEALRAGMPPSAGIAMGVDRLVMVCCAGETISRLLPYDF
jgi:lysyl-tRNA synthetase class 2